MDENPFKSPESEPEVVPRPGKPANPYAQAAICGFLALIGVFDFQIAVVKIVVPDPLSLLPYTLLLFFLMPCSVCVAMARWAWLRPESALPLPAAMLLFVSGYAPFFVGKILEGLR